MLRSCANSAKAFEASEASEAAKAAIGSGVTGDRSACGGALIGGRGSVQGSR